MSAVNCYGENHAWNEVYLNGNETVIIDATAVKLPSSTGFMSSDFMQKKVSGDWRALKEYPKEGDISYVFCNYPNDNTEYDVTDHYTDTFNLTINVIDSNGKPLNDAVVKIFSHNRPNWVSSIGIDKKTNEVGQCTFKIGGGRYHFSFQKNGDIGAVETEVKFFWENESQQYYSFVYKSSSIFDNPYIIPAIIAIFCMLGLYLGFKKLPKK